MQQALNLDEGYVWTRTYSKFYPNVSSKTICKIWIDINSCPRWHGDLDYCKLDGDFKVGNYFTLKPKGVPAVKIMLTEINEGHSFTDCTKFFGAKLNTLLSKVQTGCNKILKQNK